MQPVAPSDDASVSSFVGTLAALAVRADELGDKYLWGVARGLNSVEPKLPQDTIIKIRISPLGRIHVRWDTRVVVAANEGAADG